MSPYFNISSLFSLILITFISNSAYADVVINEFQAAQNLSVMEWNANQEPHIGPQPFWQDVDFHELKWYAGMAPIGVGTGNLTNLSSLIFNKVPGFYMRKTFLLTPLQAASAGTLTLRIRYDDGFVAYLNGREVARANMGPAKQITYGSMITSRADVPPTTMDFIVGAPAAAFLQAGANVLAIEVHNRDLTSDSTCNASLFSTIATVTSTLLDENLNSGNDASTTFVNTLGNVSNSANGTAPPNSWLAMAPAPVTSPLWESLRIETTALSVGGRSGTGGQRYDFSQTGPNQAAAVFGGPVVLSPYLTAAAFTVADLSKITASFRYRISPGSSYGFRIQPTTPGSAGLSGTTWTLSEAASTGESNLRNYVASAGGTRTLKVASTGVQSIVNTSTPLYDTTLFADPGVRGGEISAECKLIEDNTTGNGSGASTGVLKFGVTTAPDGRPGYNADCAFRVAGSPFTRIRYTLNTIQNAPWNYDSVFEKPSINLFFRSSLGPGTMDFPIMGEEYPYQEFDSLRLRGGHNDIRDPFIKDEFSRRLLAEEGQDSSVGIFVPLYVNAKFRGYYNLTERLREPFMRQHHHSAAEWDVKMITDTADGDPIYYNDWMARLNAYRSAPTEAKYAAIAEVTDLTNLADYLILNVWNSMGDWPQNNYTFARERTSAGKWRCYVWDAEGGFGAFNKHIAYNTFIADLETDILNPLRPLCLVWSALKNSTEFRLHFADRINRQMCNGGALTDARATALKNKLLAQLQPYFTFTGGGTLSSDWFNTYVNPTANDRRDYLFQSIRDPLNAAVENGKMFTRAGVWPLTTPPLFNQHGGDVAAGFTLSIHHTDPVWNRNLDNPYAIASNPAPAGKTIYYTINGTDPDSTEEPSILPHRPSRMPFRSQVTLAP